MSKLRWLAPLVAAWLAVPCVVARAADPDRAQELATEFNASTTEIMDVHRNQGLSWDEIRKALMIAQHSGTPFGEVVRLRREGRSLEDIASAYNLKLEDLEKQHEAMKDRRKDDFREAPAATRTDRKAVKLAEEYMVSETVVTGLREKGYSWKDVKHTLSLADRSGRPIEEITGLHDSGKSFEDIAEQFSLKLRETRDERRARDEKRKMRDAPKADEKSDVRDAPASTNVSRRARRLGEEFNVSAEEVQGLKDKGFSWGDVRHALSISQRSGRPATEIGALRESGMEWEEIAARYNLELKEGRGRDRKAEESQGEGGTMRDSPSSTPSTQNAEEKKGGYRGGGTDQGIDPEASERPGTESMPGVVR